MAHILTRDSIDFEAYLAATECSTKVRPASDYFPEVRAGFAQASIGRRGPGMTSTKLDTLIDFAPSEVTAWTGYNGHRKSMFTSQVSIDMAAAGKRVLLASFEMTPPHTLMRMARQASATNHPSEMWLADFENWSNGRIWLFDHMGVVSTDETLGLCRYFADKLDGAQVFIDSMMMVVASEESMDEQKQFMTDIVRVAQETGLHIHLVTHCRKPQSGDESRPPSRYDIRGAAAVSDQADNAAIIWANKAKKTALVKCPHDEVELAKPDALVIIDKQRHGGFEGQVQLWFDERSLRFCDTRTATVEPYDLGGE